MRQTINNIDFRIQWYYNKNKMDNLVCIAIRNIVKLLIMKTIFVAFMLNNLEKALWGDVNFKTEVFQNGEKRKEKKRIGKSFICYFSAIGID